MNFSDKTSDAQAVIFIYRLNNHSSYVFLLAKTVNTVKYNACHCPLVCVPADLQLTMRGISTTSSAPVNPAWRSTASGRLAVKEISLIEISVK